MSIAAPPQLESRHHAQWKIFSDGAKQQLAEHGPGAFLSFDRRDLPPDLSTYWEAYFPSDQFVLEPSEFRVALRKRMGDDDLLRVVLRTPVNARVMVPIKAEDNSPLYPVQGLQSVGRRASADHLVLKKVVLDSGRVVKAAYHPATNRIFQVITPEDLRGVSDPDALEWMQTTNAKTCAPRRH